MSPIDIWKSTLVAAATIDWMDEVEKAFVQDDEPTIGDAIHCLMVASQQNLCYCVELFDRDNVWRCTFFFRDGGEVIALRSSTNEKWELAICNAFGQMIDDLKEMFGNRESDQ